MLLRAVLRAVLLLLPPLLLPPLLLPLVCLAPESPSLALALWPARKCPCRTLSEGQNTRSDLGASGIGHLSACWVLMGWALMAHFRVS